MSEENKSKDKISTYILFGFLFVLIVWLLGFLLIPTIYGKPKGPGIFGDMFGGVNTFFSGLAFAGVIIALLLQKRELELQREELGLTRKEFKEQNKILDKQAFENTFFQMIRLHNDIVNSIEIQRRASKKILKGFSFFDECCSLFKNYFDREGEGTTKLRIGNSYKKFFKDLISFLHHYFRNMQTILEFLKENNIKPTGIYVRIFLSQFNDQELCLIFYHCASKSASSGLLDLVSKYSFFRDLNTQLLIDDTHKYEINEKALKLPNSQ